jgi:hypothetical protein
VSVFETIALVANAQIRFFMIDIARELKARHGSRIHLYCADFQERAFYESQNTDKVFDTISLYESILDHAIKPVVDPNREIVTGRAIEARLGRSYNTIAVANRHLGRGYALLGFYHPRSRYSEQSTSIQMVAAYNRYFAFWDREVNGKNFSIIIGGPSEVANAARMHGLPYRRLAGSRYKNLHFWGHDEFNTNSALERAYERENSSAGGFAEMREAYKLVGTMDKLYRRDNSFFGMAYWVLFRFAQRTYWRARGYKKANAYIGIDELVMLFRRWRDGRRMTAKTMSRLADIAGRPFVFFPLATEPESSLQQFSPEFFFQHAAIAALSRDLPAGVLLVVKESIIGVGRRPDNFYDQIVDLKNVVMLNMLEQGLKIARDAVAVATITGSTGFEAAVMGKPVISFGVHNGYNMLPHVFHVTDLARSGDAVRKIFEGAVDPDEAKRAGARYLQAVIDTSFDMGSYDYVNLKNYDQGVVRAASDALETTFGAGNRAISRVAVAV